MNSMRLFLMRHGIACERGEWSGTDEARPLSANGRERTQAIAKALKKNRRPVFTEIWTSPLQRARETAEIVGRVFGVAVQDCAELACGADLERLQNALRRRPDADDVLLVGHEPDCGWILAQLLGEPEPRPFKKAGVACVEGELKRGGMRLRWLLTPKDLLED
jgi:phosphohistidine phosphatase